MSEDKIQYTQEEQEVLDRLRKRHGIYVSLVNGKLLVAESEQGIIFNRPVGNNYVFIEVETPDHRPKPRSRRKC